jgi:hypothetical protein
MDRAAPGVRRMNPGFSRGTTMLRLAASNVTTPSVLVCVWGCSAIDQYRIWGTFL